MGGVCSDDGGNLPYIDFDNSRPSSSETPLYNEIQSVLSHTAEVLRSLDEYKGCQELARKAMSSPSLENEQEAFEGLLLAVRSIATFYHYAKDLERIVPLLLETLAAPSDQILQVFQQKQASLKLLGDIFDFTLRFDTLRMLRPSISNDFSYYRRLLPKFARHPHIVVRDDDASGMALFTAEHIPFMASLTRATSSLIERTPQAALVLGTLASCCRQALRQHKYGTGGTASARFAARCMTGAIVLLDRAAGEPMGVFGSKSAVHIKVVVQILKRDFNGGEGDGLLNTIHYSTLHFKDASPAIQSLFN